MKPWILCRTLYISLMRLTCAIWFLVCLCLAVHTPAYASDVAENENATLRLIVDTERLKPGESSWAAIEFELKEHWHIYWVNPGDSGLAAELNWTLPDGLSAGPIHWPTPIRIEYSGLFNYGYEGQTGLLVPITVDEGARLEPFEMSVHVSYLICKDICVPEEATLSASITPGVIDTTASDRIDELLDRLPVSFKDRAEYDINDGRVYAAFDLTNQVAIDPRRVYKAWWYPRDEQVISNADEQRWRLDDEVLIISVEREGNQQPDSFRGILEIKTTDGQIHQLYANAAYRPADEAGLPTSIRVAEADVTNAEASATNETLTFWVALGFAFLGGLILNIMPCVLPVLSLKALSISKKSDQSASVIRLQGLSYTAGIVVSFLLIAGLILALKQTGTSIGWGFQLQSPLFVSVLTYILFLVGLNLSGVFEIPSGFSNVGASLTRNDGVVGSFFTGVLAAIVATPCIAPFMATAIGFALSQPAYISVAIFAALGIGMASPFLLISIFPSAVRLLPKPGNWMIIFKQFLAFPIYATVIWLVWVLVQQTDPMGLIRVLSGLLVIFFFIWLLPNLKSLFTKTLSLLLAIGLLAYSVQHDTVSHVSIHSESVVERHAYSADALQSFRDEGRPVFVYATAAWCITCKVNERVALNDRDVIQALHEMNAVILVADWTSRDDAITEYLASFNRNGVPIYVFYPPSGEPRVLPQILTPSIMLDYVDTNELGRVS